jgi:hypothetical protein
VKAIKGKLVRRDIVPDLTRGRGLGDEVTDEAPEHSQAERDRRRGRSEKWPGGAVQLAKPVARVDGEGVPRRRGQAQRCVVEDQEGTALLPDGASGFGFQEEICTGVEPRNQRPQDDPNNTRPRKPSEDSLGDGSEAARASF